MKYFFIFICLALCGCNEKYTSSSGLRPTLTPNYLSASPTNLFFTSEASVAPHAITIQSFNTPWVIDNNISWISISTIKGSNNTSSLDVSVEENNRGDESRMGIFYFRSASDKYIYEQPIAVTQEGNVPYINLSQNELNLNGSTHIENITVTSNCSWYANCPYDWITINKQENSLTLTTTENSTYYHRYATIYINHEGSNSITKTITISQAPASITSSVEAITFDNKAGTSTFSINAEADWTASTENSWVDISPSSGKAGIVSVEVSVARNTYTSERTGHIVLFIGDSKKIEIPVKQKGLYLETQENELSFTSKNDKKTLSINSNTSWTIVWFDDWIRLSDIFGVGDKSISVSVEDNPYTTNRIGSIIIAQDGTNKTTTINIKQTGKTFDVVTTVLNFSDKQSTQTVNIETDGTWEATSSDDWITLSPLSDTDNSILNVNVSENYSESERNGEITISMGAQTKQIAVVQQGKYFILDNAPLKFGSKGGTASLNITTNCSWSATIKQDEEPWLSLSESYGDGNIELEISASDNASPQERRATITVSANGRNTIIIVSQSGRYLMTNAYEVAFFAKGGASEPILIETDGKYIVYTEDSWVSIGQTGNSIIISTSENSSSNPRFGIVTIRITDLKEGVLSTTIDIIQLPHGETFIMKKYSTDKNWNSDVNTIGNINIDNYGDDNNWDNAIGNNDSSIDNIKLDNYGTDSNWN